MQGLDAIDDGAGCIIMTKDGGLPGFGSAAEVTVQPAVLEEAETAVDLLLVQF